MGRLRVGWVQLDTMGQHHVGRLGFVEHIDVYIILDIETNQVHGASSTFINLFVLGIFEHIGIDFRLSVKTPSTG